MLGSGEVQLRCGLDVKRVACAGVFACRQQCIVGKFQYKVQPRSGEVKMRLGQGVKEAAVKFQSGQDSMRVEATLVETECFKSGCYETESR